MSLFNDIQAALESQLTMTYALDLDYVAETYATGNSAAFGLDTAWPNSGFIPTGAHIRPAFLPGDTIPAAIGATAQDVTNGVYQIDILDPKGGGRTQIADAIADIYSRGSQLASGSVIIRIRSTSIGAGQFEGEYYRTPIIINWQTYTEAR